MLSFDINRDQRRVGHVNIDGFTVGPLNGKAILPVYVGDRLASFDLYEKGVLR